MIIICNSCGKQFHCTCNLPWVCSVCQAEGCRVRVATTALVSQQTPPSNASQNSHQPVLTSQTESNRVTTIATCISISSTEQSTPQSQTSVSLTDTNGRSSSSSELILSETPLTPAIINQAATTDVLMHDVCVRDVTKQRSIDQMDRAVVERRITCNDGLNGLQETNLTPTALRPARSNDVKSWNVDQVSDWLIEQGFAKEADCFLQQEIDGMCLILLKRMDVLIDVGIKLGPAVKIFERIKQLQNVLPSDI